MKLALSIVLTVAWFAAIFVGAHLATTALQTAGRHSEGLADLGGAMGALLSYQAAVERSGRILGIGLVLFPAGTLVIVRFVYGRPTLGARILVLLTAAAAFAVLLWDAIVTDALHAGPYGVLRIVEVVIVGSFVLGAFFWVVGAGISAEKLTRESP